MVHFLLINNIFCRVNTMTLGSLLSNYVQKQMKQLHSKHNTPEMIQKYYAR